MNQKKKIIGLLKEAWIQRRPYQDIEDEAVIALQPVNIKVPTKEEFLAFWKEEGFNTEVGEQVFIGYYDNLWCDSQGKPIKNWKMKCRQVWFKPQNKVKEMATGKPSVLSENQRIFEAATNNI